MDYRIAAPLFLAIAVVAACGSPASDWADASRQNSIGAYRAFINRYPTDVRAPDASRAIRDLQDEQAWARAQVASNIDGFKAYLKQRPNGRHAQTAKENIIERERSYAWSLLPGDKTPTELQTFLSRYPSGPEADQARLQLRALTAYRAEFATARRRQVVDRRRQQVAGRLKMASPELVILEPDSQSDRYRLTSAPLSEKQVNQLCERAAQLSQACWIVKATS